jgi:hypothetical protein
MGNSGSWPIYTFSGNGNTYAFEFNNTPTITVSVNGGAATPSLYHGISGAVLLPHYYSYVIADGGVNLTINQLIRSSVTNNNNVKVHHLQP